MSDLISRDDAIKAFEDEKQKAREDREYFAKYAGTEHEQAICNEAVKTWRKTIDIVNKLPTIDAVPVVRRKECVHYIKHDKRCGIWNHGIDSNGYCYKGEREDDDNH